MVINTRFRTRSTINFVITDNRRRSQHNFIFTQTRFTTRRRTIVTKRRSIRRSRVRLVNFRRATRLPTIDRSNNTRTIFLRMVTSRLTSLTVIVSSRGIIRVFRHPPLIVHPVRPPRRVPLRTQTLSQGQPNHRRGY